MKRFTKISAFITLIFFLTSAISCSTQNSSSSGSTTLEKTTQKKIVLGFSQLGDESDWRAANTESIKSAAKKAGIELKFSNAYQKQDEQIKAIRSFIAQQVDVIAFSPFVESGWDSY
jgi:simple sugar transport system substrate-binding protein